MNAAPLRARLAQALDLQRQGRDGDALRLCVGVLDHHPDHAGALLLAGRLSRRLGDPGAAAAYLARVAAISPGLPQLLSEQGYLALQVEDCERAVRLFERLVVLRPQDADAVYNLGYAQELTYRTEEAAESFRRALALGCNDRDEVRCRMAAMFARNGEEARAIEAFNEVLGEDPEQIPALYGLADVEVTRGNFDQAALYYRRILTIKPDYVQACQRLAHVRRFTSLDEPELVAMETMIAEPATPDADREALSFALAKVCDDLGEYERAFAHAQRANVLQGLRRGGFDAAAFADQIERVIGAWSGPLDRPGADEEAVAPQPIFIIGMPRSGTTLVEQILSSHSQVAGAGELPFFSQAAATTLDPFPERALRLDEALRRQLCEQFRALLSRLGDGAPHVTDKFPGNFLYLGLLRELFPRAPIIHCRRNPLDTGLSIYFQDFFTSQPYSNDLAEIARHYQRYRRLMAHWEKVLPGALLTLDYEQVIADQESQTRRLLDFCGLEFEPQCLDFRKNPRAVNTLSNWQVRQPLYTRAVERWRNYEAHLGPLIAAFGKE